MLRGVGRGQGNRAAPLGERALLLLPWLAGQTVRLPKLFTMPLAVAAVSLPFLSPLTLPSSVGLVAVRAAFPLLLPGLGGRVSLIPVRPHAAPHSVCWVGEVGRGVTPACIPVVQARQAVALVWVAAAGQGHGGAVVTVVVVVVVVVVVAVGGSQHGFDQAATLLSQFEHDA